MEKITDAAKDFLTGCYTKESLVPMLDKFKAECKIHKCSLSILVIDLDRFKSFNEKYGHLYGDELLKYFSGILLRVLHETDCITLRFGGDEFIVLLPGKGYKETKSFVKEIGKNIIDHPFLLRGRFFRVTFSGGIASYPRDDNDISKVLYKADKALFFSKNRGRKKITPYGFIGYIKIARFLTALALIAFIVVSAYLYRDVVLEKINIVKGAVKTNLYMRHAKLPGEPGISGLHDVVYMKSGGVFYGTIVGEKEDELEFKLRLDRGEGVMVIKKENIRKIERNKRSLAK